MFNIILGALYRTVFAYFLLLLLARMMGRKAISHLTFFDFAVSITIGEMTAQLAIGESHTVLGISSGLIVIALLTIILDFAHIKSYMLRKIINSRPLTLIKNGKVVDENMKKSRFAIDDLMMELRKKNVFNIADVEFGIIETSGEITVLKRSDKNAVTPADLNIPVKYNGLTRNIIMDGNVMHDNLRREKKDERWLMNELNKYGISSAQEVFYAGLDSSGNLYISEKIVPDISNPK